MAICPNSNERLFGGAVVLEVADGCADVVPTEQEWKSLAAGNSKGFDFGPNTVTSDADDGAGFVESIVTNSDFTISFEGEVRKRDRLDQYGIGKFIQYFAAELAARRQPGLWVRMEYGPVQFIGYMVITALSSDGGTNDIVTFTTEFKVGDASTIEVKPANTLYFTSNLAKTINITAGQPLSFSVKVAGGKPQYTYKWFKGTQEVTGQTTDTFNKATATTAADSGIYSVQVTDADTPPNVIKSTSITVTVN